MLMHVRPFLKIAAWCRLSLGGPVVPETKQPALYKIPIIPVGERVLLHIGCFVQACGHLSVQPFVSLPVNMSGMHVMHSRSKS